MVRETQYKDFWSRGHQKFHFVWRPSWISKWPLLWICFIEYLFNQYRYRGSLNAYTYIYGVQESNGDIQCFEICGGHLEIQHGRHYQSINLNILLSSKDINTVLTPLPICLGLRSPMARTNVSKYVAAILKSNMAAIISLFISISR